MTMPGKEIAHGVVRSEPAAVDETLGKDGVQKDDLRTHGLDVRAKTLPERLCVRCIHGVFHTGHTHRGSVQACPMAEHASGFESHILRRVYMDPTSVIQAFALVPIGSCRSCLESLVMQRQNETGQLPGCRHGHFANAGSVDLDREDDDTTHCRRRDRDRPSSPGAQEIDMTPCAGTRLVYAPCAT